MLKASFLPYSREDMLFKITLLSQKGSIFVFEMN